MNFGKPRRSSRKNSISIIKNTEKWKHHGRNVIRKRRDYIEEDSEDDETRSEESINWEEQFIIDEKLSEIDQDTEVHLTVKQTLLLATLVPDELLLLEKFEKTEPSRFVGVLLMADVSGYTALSERYYNTGEGGTCRLTATLNTYIGSLTEVIYTHGGDVIKFAGDAFLALWKTDKRTFLCHTIHGVIACALIIQHSYGSYETDVKVNLKVKLAISAGNLIFATIGTGIDMNYIILGLPVQEAKIAESVCTSGDVRLTPTAWGHCYSRNYDHVIHEDGHVTIKSILYDPQDKDVSKPFLGFGNMIRKNINISFNAIENLPDFVWESTKNVTIADLMRNNETLNVRKTILLSENRKIGTEIRKFMIRPVLTQIDGHQPLEYLTEIREVSILFITLKPMDCPFMQLITIVNNSYQITCEIVYKSMGCVNKIILFDKDVMILVIFGLRGFKHESEAQAALKCSYSIKKSIAVLDGVKEVSIGITTGQVYCGVVGHPLRREFTVIGAIVNKAARLMCYFGNKITCDETTYVKSKMSKNAFTLQPKTKLKGIVHSGNIYEYSEEIRVKEINNIPMIAALLNRKDEMKYFEKWIDDYKKTYRDFDALLLTGEPRIGKTRLLEWMARYARNKNLHVCYINLTSIHSATPFLTLSQIINQILGITEPVIGFEKEEKIIQLLQEYDENLCYLNNIIKVRFAYHEGVYSLNEENKKIKAISTFKKLIASITKTHIVLLDDLQNLDSNSWEFISIMLNTMKIFTVLTLTRGKFTSFQGWIYDIFCKDNIRKIVLERLDYVWIPALACQILDVNAVSNDLCNALKSKCKGVPGAIENFILNLFSSGALEVKKIENNELDNWINKDYKFPDPILLHPQAFYPKDQVTLDEFLQNEVTNEISVCIVTQKEKLKKNMNVQKLDTFIMMQIDSLTPYQQLLLKIASVIGNIFSRDLLENIMYENNTITTAKAIKRLFAMRILMCANIKTGLSGTISTMSTVSIKTNTIKLSCECDFEYDLDTNENLPKYAFCKVMKFRNKLSRKTFYELLPMNQKKQFHSRIVNYLENKNQKCPDCRGQIVVVSSELQINFKNLMRLQTISSSDSATLSENSEYKYKEFTQQLPSSAKARFNDNKKVKSESHIKQNYLSNSCQVLTKQSSFQFRDKIKKRNVSEKDYDTVSKSSSRILNTALCYDEYSESSISIKNLKILHNLRGVTEADTINDWHSLGIIDNLDNINTEENNKFEAMVTLKIEKGVSQVNFDRCTCAELNLIIYEQLIEHAKYAEMKVKMIEFLIILSSANLQRNDVNTALNKLEEAERNILKEQSNEIITAFNKRRLLGKVYTLKAAANLLSSNLSAAKQNIERAMRIYHINLSELFNLKSVATKISLSKIRDTTMTRDSVHCLNVATLLYVTLGNDSIARKCAQRARKSLQKVQCNIVDICETFANAIQIEHFRGNLEIICEIEKTASQVLKKLLEPVKAEELFATGKLFMTIFRARMARAKLAATIRSGFQAFVVSRFLRLTDISLDILPDLFYILLARGRIREAVDVVKEALLFGQNCPTLNCETWYYALCLDMILDAGFQLESPAEITRFGVHALQNVKDRSARRRLTVGLWTYWLRVDPEGKARRFESEALSWANNLNDDGSLSTLISAMRLAEGMIVSLATKVDDLRKVVDLMELRSLADRELARLEKDAQMCRTIYPRWILMKANSLKMSSRSNSASIVFNQALEEARRIHNKLEESLILAATSKCSIWLQQARTGIFINWQEAAERVHKSWPNLLYNYIITTNSNLSSINHNKIPR